MKDNLFQRIFARKSHESLPRARRLSLESLENRELLNVDWGGLGAETTVEYEAGSSSSYTVDLQDSPDYCHIGDFDGDKISELATVDFSEQTITIYSNKSGAFTVANVQKWDAVNASSADLNAVVADDFDGDGRQELLLVSSSALDLKATLYKWNVASKSFEQSSQTVLSVSSLLGANSGCFLDVSATTISDSNGVSLVVQVEGLDFSTGQFTKTAVYSGFGSSSFGKSASIKSAVVGDLLGSTTIDGTDYLVLKQTSSSANKLVLTSLGATVKNYVYDLSGYGTVTFDWVVEQDGFLVVGAQNNGSSGLITIKSTTPVDGADATLLGNWVACDDLKFNYSSVAAIGNIGGDSSPEVFVANGTTYVFYSGKVSDSCQYEFTHSGIVVTSPEYSSVFVGDVDKDSKTEALLVGSEGLYVADVDASGKMGEASLSYRFNQPVKKAVFGDFNADGLTDFAVQYKANVGSSLQVFQQLSDGSFVAIASQSISGTLIDVGVGKFTQTSVDEIVVLAKTGVGGKAKTSVYTYKLKTSGSSSLTQTYTFGDSTIIGSSISVGSVYGGNLDDAVVVNSTQDTITILKNSGSSFQATTVTTNFNNTTQKLAPVSVAIGDFNGDGLNDVAALNSSAGSNYANVVYYLRTADGVAAKPTGMVSVNGTTAVDGLVSCDFNNDGYADLALVKKLTNGSSAVSVLAGNGTSTVFDSAIDYAAGLDPSSSFGVALARVDSGNVSNDFVWAQGKKVGVFLNSDASVASGSIQILCQSLSSESGNSLATALETQRAWIDEWSYFYMDVWASTGSSDVVTKLTATLDYNSNYFMLGGVVGSDGYNVESKDDGSSITLTAEGNAVADAEGWTLVARVKFVPAGSVSGATKTQKAGVPVPSDGVFTSVVSGFDAQKNKQSVNGGGVDSVTSPSSISLYPFVYDIDDNGDCSSVDYSTFLSYYGVGDVSQISVSKCRLFDCDGKNGINSVDYSTFLQYYGRSSTQARDSVYVSDPGNRVKVAQTSQISKDAFDAAFVAEAAFEEEVEIVDEVVNSFVADSAPLISTNDVVDNENVQDSSEVVYGPVFLPAFSSMTSADELEFGVDVDLNVVW